MPKARHSLRFVVITIVLIVFSAVAIDAYWGVPLAIPVISEDSVNLSFLAVEPTVQVTNLVFSNVTQNSVTLSWTNGNGASRILFGHKGSAPTTVPVDGVTYAQGQEFPNGDVVAYSGSGNSFTTPNDLAGGTTYFGAIYEYNGSGGIENYLTTNPATGSTTTPVATYAWNGSVDSSYQSTNNWTPARNPDQHSSSDILLFQNGGTDNVTDVGTETIGQLKVSGNTLVNLSTSFQPSGTGTISVSGNTVTGVGTSFTTELAVGDVIFGFGGGIPYSDVAAIASNTSLTLNQTRTAASQAFFRNQTLTISGAIPSGSAPGDDLTVAAGSQLNINGNNPNNLRITLAAAATGNISGSMTFSGSGNVAHRLTALSAGAITFQSGSVFTGGLNFFGSPFGASTLNAGSVIFANGSTFVYQAGGSVFGAVAPNAAAVFQTGSLYMHESSVFSPPLGGRTYANFELNNAAANFAPTGSNSPLIVDNLTITAGSLTIGSFGTGHAIKGNITVNAGATLNFSPASASTFDLNGSAVQTISGGGTLTSNSFQTINVNNPNGVTLARSVSLGGDLALTSGTINTGANTLQITAGNVTRTAGYVIGTLQKNYSSAGAKTFEVGTANGYAPVDVNVTTSSPGGAPFTVKAVQGTQPNIPQPGKALSRYWTLSGATLTADLTFYYLDPTDIPATATEGNFVIQKYNGAFSQPGGSVDTAANTATITGVSSFSDWTLAEPAAVVAGTATVSGRVVTSSGATGLRNATVSMTLNGVVRTTTTSSFGFFSFDNVATGQQYTFRVQSRLYRYSPVVVTINNDVTLPDFVGLE